MNQTSIKKLNTCHPDLIRLASAVDLRYPIQVICGHRNLVEQNEAVARGNSKLMYPMSKHNKIPSRAMDIVPDPDKNPATIDFNDIKEFEKMCKIIEEVAKELGIKVRLGKHFKFKDYPHVELL